MPTSKNLNYSEPSSDFSEEIEEEMEAAETITFRDFGLDDRIVEAVEASGYTTPTPIQARTIPFLMEGRDLLGQAQTGTGKTAAFALPLLHRINPKSRSTQVLVLTPTRELAIQVAESFEKYAEKLPSLRIAAIYGGQDYQVQFRQLHQGAQIIVGTPGRVMDHMRKESLKLDALQCLVLDEADEMLRMGFAEDVDWILTQIPEKRQTALFSATMPDQIRRIANQHLTEPVEITIAQEAATADTIRQRYVVATPDQKSYTLARILEAEPVDGAIIFVKMKTSCEPLAEYLNNRGFRAGALHGDIAQKQRERIIDQLKSGRLNVIVATDVAARGLDVQRISHVINYDLPFDSEAYVHRIGRTGRAGRSGEAILFVSPREKGRLKRLEHAMRKRIEPMEFPTNRTINKKRVDQFHARIAEALKHREMESFQSIVEQFRRANEEIPIEQVAAALAIMANGGKPLLEREEFKPATFAQDDRGRRRDDRPGRMDRGDRGDRGGRMGRPDARRGERRPRSNEEPMETFRIEVGRDHGVTPGNIVGAIANEIGIDSEYIGRIQIDYQYSTVDLPEGLPNDLFQALKRVHVLGQRLNISRFQADRGGPRRGPGPRTGKPRRPKATV